MAQDLGRGNVPAAALAIPAALAVLMLAGCSSAPDGGTGVRDKPAKGPNESAQARAKVRTAAKGATVGGAGTPCALPVSFSTATDWTAEKVTVGDDPVFGSLAKQGTVELVCEIDAKPAGNIGYLRVWTGDDTGTPREVLEGFMADEKKAGTVRYRETKAGELPATEVTYTTTSELLDGPKKERALAVNTSRGAVVLHLGGMDTREHEQMLPAYELAKKTMSAGG
ncbi:lipoprotein [Streptomyces flavidovirens]|uniref:lipoprotein n=1 Tax=Streptomyces flavidovirens TaxID=67298 RepID=UPI003681B4EE